MAQSSQIDLIAERVERLLVRYEELQRTNALLAAQVESLTQERDSLKSRLSAARSLRSSPRGISPSFGTCRRAHDAC